MHFLSGFVASVSVAEILKVVLINLTAILIMSTKLCSPVLLGITVF